MGEDWWNPLTWEQDVASAIGSASAAVGDWWASSSIWDKLDMAMTIVGFIPGLDVVSDAYFLGRSPGIQTGTARELIMLGGPSG